MDWILGIVIDFFLNTLSFFPSMKFYWCPHCRESFYDGKVKVCPRCGRDVAGKLVERRGCAGCGRAPAVLVFCILLVLLMQL